MLIVTDNAFSKLFEELKLLEELKLFEELKSSNLTSKSRVLSAFSISQCL